MDTKRSRLLLALTLVISSATLVVSTSTPANADGYDQTGWHATSDWNEGTTTSTTVIDCASMIIANMGTGQIATPGTGIIAGMGVEVDLKNAHPRVNESFYVHVWGRSIGTPCGGEGFIPIVSLPAGVTLDTSKAVVCFSDGAALNTATCPQPGAAGAKFQSAQSETGNPNSWKILCGYASGCLGYAWPAAYGHGFEFGIPVKASQTFNGGQVGGGAFVVDPYINALKPLTAPLNVFSATAGNGAVPGTVTPTGGGAPVPDPGTTYRIVNDNPSTYASPTFPNNTSMNATYGVISTSTAYTNGVAGVFVIGRDSDPAKLNQLSTSLQTLSDQTDHGTIPVNQFTYGSVGSGGGASYQVDYDWGDTANGSTVWGTNPAAWAPGATYYWKLGFAPTPNGTSDVATAKVTWGPQQTFVAPATGSLTCNSKKVTVSLALGQLPTDGDDVILGTPGNDSVNGGKGNDTICGLGGNDVLVGGPGNDSIFGGDGDDTMLPGVGFDTAYGDAGTDTVSYADISAPYTVAQPNGGVTFNPSGCSSGYITVCGAGGTDIISGPGRDFPERFVGSPFDDIILALPGPGAAYGGDGNDEIHGSDGNDVLIGGAGTDSIYGRGGDDTIDVLDGQVDTVSCDAGNDTVTSDAGDHLTACELVNPRVSPPATPALPLVSASWIKKWPAKSGSKKARVGKRLKVTRPTWSPSGKSQGLSVSYQWLVGGVPVSGAPSFKVAKAYKHQTVTLVLSINKAGYAPLTKAIGYGKAK